MTRLTLEALERKVFGKKVKTLRREGRLPSNIYGKKIKSLAIDVDLKEFSKLFKESGETSLVDLMLNKKKHTVLIRNIQKNPVTDIFLHVDFQEVDLKEKVTAMVPLEVVGESPAEKQGIGTLVTQADEVEVEALPEDLPEKFEIDATKLTEVDQAFTIADIKVNPKVEIKDPADKILAKVEPPMAEEVVEATPAEGEAVEGGEKAEAPAAETPADTKEEPKS